MNRVWIAVSAASVLAAACGAPSSQAGGTPSAAAATSPARTSIQCKLPVAGIKTGGGYVAAAGFVSIPQGNLVMDAGGNLLGDRNNLWHTATAPQLVGSEASPAYDRSQSRWVPALPSAISPDGSQYAYTETRPRTSGQLPSQPIHVVDVASGADRVVHNTGQFDVAAYTDEGIYLVHHVTETDGSDGLWLLNPRNGVLRQIGSRLEWRFPAGASAWSTDVDPKVAPPPEGAFMRANRVERLDLKTGAVTPWFTRGGEQVSVVGVDTAGHPFIQVGTATTSEVWIASSPTSAEKLFGSATGAASFTGFWYGQPDIAGRVWFAYSNGISLYQPGKGLQQMVDTTQLDAHGLGLQQARPAGRCIS